MLPVLCDCVCVCLVFFRHESVPEDLLLLIFCAQFFYRIIFHFIDEYETLCCHPYFLLLFFIISEFIPLAIPVTDIFVLVCVFFNCFISKLLILYFLSLNYWIVSYLTLFYCIWTLKALCYDKLHSLWRVYSRMSYPDEPEI